MSSKVRAKAWGRNLMLRSKSEAYMEIAFAEVSAQPQAIETLQSTKISSEASSSCMAVQDGQENLSFHPMQEEDDERISLEAQHSSRKLQPTQAQVHKFPPHYVSVKTMSEPGETALWSETSAPSESNFSIL